MIQCKIGYQIDDSLNSMRQFVRDLQPVWSASSRDDCVLDLTRCRYLGPDAATILLAVVLQLKSEERPVTVYLPMEPAALVAFLEFSGLNHWIELVKRYVNLTQDHEDYLRYSVNEVTQNVVDHAASPIGAVRCARFLKNLKEVRIAVVDFGVGIAESLRMRYPDTTSSAIALQRVIAGNYSA